MAPRQIHLRRLHRLFAKNSKFIEVVVVVVNLFLRLIDLSKLDLLRFHCDLSGQACAILLTWVETLYFHQLPRDLRASLVI